jgi:hypothetical protein
MKKIVTIKKAQPGAAMRNLPAGTNPKQMYVKNGGNVRRKK